MAQDSPKGYHVEFYDFGGDTIPDELATSSDTGTISNGVTGGDSILRIDNSNDGDNEMCEVDFGALYYRVQEGHMYMEARVKLERVVCAVNVGFNDDSLEASNTLPAELAGTTWTSNASTWIGFVFDSDATNANWHVFWVDDDNDTSVGIAALNTGIAVVAGRWYTIRIDLWDQGSGYQARAHFHITDGTNTWDYESSATIDRDATQVPHLACENRTNTGAYLDIDYVEAGKSRSVN